MFVWLGKYLWYTINIREGKNEASSFTSFLKNKKRK